jgi:hypothetical protein
LPSGVKDWSEATGDDAVRAGVLEFASKRKIPAAFVSEWVKKNAPTGYSLFDGGKTVAPADVISPDTYNSETRTLRVKLSAPHLAKLESDYKASLITNSLLPPEMALARQYVIDDETSAGEKLLGVAAPVVQKGARAVDLATRPLQAIDAAFWSKVQGADNLDAVVTAYQQFFGDDPVLGKNVIAEALKNSDRLRAINPRLPVLLGELANMIVEPSNLIPVGLIGKAGKLLRGGEEVGALGRLAERARKLGFVERGMVEAKPLGLVDRSVASGGAEAIRYKGRDIIRVPLSDGTIQPFYRSTGNNSKRAGEWFPFDGVGADEQGELLLKSRFASGAMEDTVHLLHRFGSEEMKAVSERLGAADIKPGGEVATPDEVNKWLGRGAESDGSDLLDYARERHEYYSAEAASAKDPARRANAKALAEEYGQEVARLEAGETVPRVPAPSKPSGADQPSLLSRAGRTLVDVVQLPKAKAGFDLSATGRQGLAQILAHPTYFKEAMSRQVRAFASEDAANSFVEAIRSRPDFELLRENVDLSSVGDIREEVFASGLAKKIPGVRASDRAYSAALDSVRVQAWDSYTRSVAGNPNVNSETFAAIGELINISTGRGRVPILDRSELGRKIVKALNVPFFSPRNTAAKFNLISPARVVRNAMNPATRPVAWLQMRDASRGLAVFSTTLGLLSYAGLDIELNPFKPGFGKLRVGKVVYDLSGGEGYTVRWLAQMAQTFSDIEKGRKPKQSPGALTARYLRSQLQPAAAVAVDKATGETFSGEEFTYSQAAADLVVPFVVADAYKGWVAAGGSTIEEIDDAGTRGDFLNGDFSKVRTGFMGAASSAPAVLGVGVNYYDKPEDYEAERQSRMPVPTGRVAEEAKRLKLMIPPLPRSISTEGLTGDAVKLRTKGGEQLAGLNDDEYAKVKADYAAEILRVLDETIADNDYKSFGGDDEGRRTYLEFVMKGVLERFLNGQRLGMRERQMGELDKLSETQKRLESRSRQPRPGETVKLGGVGPRP